MVRKPRVAQHGVQPFFMDLRREVPTRGSPLKGVESAQIESLSHRLTQNHAANTVSLRFKRVSYQIRP